jgi:hypothetical protein
MSQFQIKGNKDELVITLWGMVQVYAIAAIVVLIIAPILLFYSLPTGIGEQLVILTILTVVGASVYKRVKVAFFKEYILFNRISQAVFYGNKLDKISQRIHSKEERKIAFSEIDFIAIIKVEQDEDYDLYLIALQLKNKESLRIYEDESPDGTKRVAEKIGTFIDKEVRRL